MLTAQPLSRVLFLAAAMAVAATAEDAVEEPARYGVWQSNNVRFAFAALLATLLCIQFGIGKGTDKNASRMLNGVHRGFD